MAWQVRHGEAYTGAVRRGRRGVQGRVGVGYGGERLRMAWQAGPVWFRQVPSGSGKAG